MKRIMYLSLLLVIPFLVSADSGRDVLNGKWISPYNGNTIKLKVKRDRIEVKNLTRGGWTSYYPSRRDSYKDGYGNTIRFRNDYELTFRSDCGRERIQFIKKGYLDYNHHNSFDNRGSRNGSYNGYNNRRPTNNYDNNTYYSAPNRIDGRYFVREIDKYITIESNRGGLRAKRGNGNWVNYTQNNNRKNEYVDHRGNKYIVRSDGDLVWKNRNGSVSLNLSR